MQKHHILNNKPKKNLGLWQKKQKNGKNLLRERRKEEIESFKVNLEGFFYRNINTTGVVYNLYNSYAKYILIIGSQCEINVKSFCQFTTIKSK